jgi:hypothetical protein
MVELLARKVLTLEMDFFGWIWISETDTSGVLWSTAETGEEVSKLAESKIGNPRSNPGNRARQMDLRGSMFPVCRNLRHKRRICNRFYALFLAKPPRYRLFHHPNNEVPS